MTFLFLNTHKPLSNVFKFGNTRVDYIQAILENSLLKTLMNGVILNVRGLVNKQISNKKL